MIGMDSIVGWLEHNGYQRASTVRESGEYAVRGGILDLFPAGPRSAGAARLLRRHPRVDSRIRCGIAAHAARHARSRPDAGVRISTGDRDHPPLPHGLCRSLRCARTRRPALRSRQRRPPPSGHGALAAAVPRADGDPVRLSRRGADRGRIPGRGCGARALQADLRLLRGPARGDVDRRWRRALQAAASGQALSHRAGMVETPRRGGARAADAVCRA